VAPPRKGDPVHRVAKTVTCPHCGLVLTIRPSKIGMRLTFAAAEWSRLCKYPALDSPVLCLAERGSRGET
jgi:hypothetical protein